MAGLKAKQIVGALFIAAGVVGIAVTLLPAGRPQIIPLIMQAALIWLGWGFIRRARQTTAMTSGATPGPVELPPKEDLAQIKEPIAACPRCGYPGMKPPTLSDGIWPGGGETNFLVCGRCACRGEPLVLDDGNAYGAFLEGLGARPRGE